jgi:hypothetical protein
MGGVEAEVGGGARPVLYGPGGATLRQAAAAAGISRTAGHYWLAQSGGVRPRSRRLRSPLRLSLDERETISRGLAQTKTLTAIAAEPSIGALRQRKLSPSARGLAQPGNLTS